MGNNADIVPGLPFVVRACDLGRWWWHTSAKPESGNADTYTHGLADALHRSGDDSGRHGGWSDPRRVAAACGADVQRGASGGELRGLGSYLKKYNQGQREHDNGASLCGRSERDSGGPGWLTEFV